MMGRSQHPSGLREPALAGAALRLDTNGSLRQGNLFGRLLESFVVAQIRAEVPVSETRPRLFHVRQQQGRLEVDLLVEPGGGGLIVIEVKADSAPTAAASRHLVRMRDRFDPKVRGPLELN